MNLALEHIQVSLSWVRVRAPELADLLGCSKAEAQGYAVELWAWAYDFINMDDGEDAITKAALKRGSAIVRAVGWQGDAAVFLRAASSEEARMLEDMGGGMYRIRGLNRVEEYRQRKAQRDQSQADRRLVDRSRDWLMANGWRESQDRKTWQAPGSEEAHSVLKVAEFLRASKRERLAAKSDSEPAPTEEAPAAPMPTEQAPLIPLEPAPPKAPRKKAAPKAEETTPSVTTLLRNGYAAAWLAGGRTTPLALPVGTRGKNAGAVDYGAEGSHWSAIAGLARQQLPKEATEEEIAACVFQRLTVAAGLTKRVNVQGTWTDVPRVNSLQDFRACFLECNPGQDVPKRAPTPPAVMAKPTEAGIRRVALD